MGSDTGTAPPSPLARGSHGAPTRQGRAPHALGQQSVGTVVSPMGLEQMCLISGFSYLLTMYYLPQSSKRSLSPNSKISTAPENNEHRFQKK